MHGGGENTRKSPDDSDRPQRRPVHPSGRIQGFRLASGSGGTTISHLRFDVDLGVIVATITDGLDNPVTDISRNLGGNRARGLHPNLFVGPVK